ncbi:MAG TPA: DNA ligase D [Polyangia bacterium]|nr:DNA ligase D [Polyangia bacterium]
MLATLADAPLRDPHLVYEPKYDGIRALIAVVPQGRTTRVTIASRNGKDKTAQFPELVAAIAAWGGERGAGALLDGEIVALDQAGRPLGFGDIQDRIHLNEPREIARLAAARPVAFIAFDLLHDGVEELTGRPLSERRVRLEAALRLPEDRGPFRIARQVAGDGTALMAEAAERGWEGLMVKDARSPYRPGRRTLEWRKVKLVKRTELLVGGFTEPRGTRTWFGALMVGVPEAGGGLRYAGHVGGGFSDAELQRVGRLLAARVTDACPFEVPPPANERPRWVRPELVAEVKFSDWTSDGMLRHPIYLGLREDVALESIDAEAAPATMPRQVPRKVTKTKTTRARVRRVAPDPAVEDVEQALAALEALIPRGSGRLALADGTIELGNLNKPLWPKLGLTKGDLMRYYVTVSPYLLPVVRDRPLVMKRFPNGIDSSAFYQQRAPDDVPAGVRSQRISVDDDVPARLVGGNLTTLVHMAQLAVISQDPWFSRAQSPAEMDFAAIDLDPMPGATFARVRDVARWVRDELDGLGIEGWLKTSGSRGLHVYLPLAAGTSFESGMLFCQLVASFIVKKHPEATTVERTVSKRDPQAVYIDCLQNVTGKTLACAYSARASDYAGASTPLAWAELDDRLDPRAFTIQSLPQRLRAVGDLWAGLRRAPGVDIHAALERVQSRR